MDEVNKKWKLFLEREKDNSYQIYCDMDGVLVDLEAGIEKKLDTANIEPEVYEKAIQVLHSGQLWQALQKEPGFGEGVDAIFDVLSSGSDIERESFWASLPPEPHMDELWKFISPHNPIILSAPWTINGGIDQACEEGKRKWLTRLDPQPRKVILTLDKPKHAAENHILIDDMLEKYVEPWRSAGGKAIHHTSTKQTIEELKKWLK